MQYKAATVAEYLRQVPAERRQPLALLRKLIRKIAPEVKESMLYGMPTYTLGEMLFALASQKNYMSLYLCDTEAVDAYRQGLGKLNCGKGCIRFKNMDDLPLDVVTKILKEAFQRRKSSAKA